MKSKKMLAVLMTAAIGIMGVAGCGGNNAAQKTDGKKDGVKWPTKPVQLIVPFTAGGDTDYNGRTIAKYLEKELGKPVTVTNVVGGGGAIADNRVKTAAPDGYTALVQHVTLNLTTASKVIDFSYKDYVMGGVFARGLGDAVIVKADSPWNSIKDMIEGTKKEPGKYKIAANTGTTSHYVAIALNNAGAKFNVVDSGGSADRVVALLGGHIDAMPAPLPSVKDYIKTGKFKALAVCNSERIPEYKDVPTLKEQGVDCAYRCNYTIFFPKGTDPAVAEKLNNAIKKITSGNKEYAAEIEKAYLQKPFSMNVADSEKHWGDELTSVMKISNELQGKVQKAAK